MYSQAQPSKFFDTGRDFLVPTVGCSGESLSFTHTGLLRPQEWYSNTPRCSRDSRPWQSLRRKGKKGQRPYQGAIQCSTCACYSTIRW